jgi:hypothetical protein
LDFTAKEYIDNQNNHSLSFNLYNFSEDNHLSPISTKVVRGSPLFITGHLSIIDDLLIVKITQINFIDSSRSSPHKSSSYAWEKKKDKDDVSSIQSSSSVIEIAKSFSTKSKKKRNYESPITSRNQKIPKLASLSLSQSTQNNAAQDQNQLNSHNINDQDDDEIHHSDDEIHYNDDEIQEIVEEQNNREIQELSQETELNVRKSRKGGRSKKSAK